MSIQSEITRIQNARNTIRAKLVSLGLAQSSDNIGKCATAIDNIANNGSPNAKITVGKSYTIAAGYYSGGKVTAEQGSGFNLQDKEVTPQESAQEISADDGYYGLDTVTVNAIPSAYKNVSSVTAKANEVLATKIYVTADGTETTGTMANNGAVNINIDGMSTTSASIPAGYTSGGAVTLTSSVENALAAI